MNKLNVAKLERISNKSLKVVLDNWKLSTDVNLEPSEVSKLNYDDSKWKSFKLNEEDVFPNGCWLRKVITVPEKIGGKKVYGKLNLFISINDIGELWIDGKLIDSWQWDKSITLTNNAKPGKRIAILLKGKSNHPMYLFWIADAYLILDKSEEIKKITDNLLLSLKTAQKLLSFDTYQKSGFLEIDPGIDKSSISKNRRKELNKNLKKLIQEIDSEALQKGNYKKFLASIDKIKKKFIPFNKFAKKYTLYFLSNAHIDAAWLWREAEVIEVCKRTFTSVLKLLNKKRDLVFIQSSPAYYKWIEEKYPQLFKKIAKKIEEGQWEIVGGMWVEPDCNLPSGEAWAKQFLYAQNYFKKKFGKNAKVGFNPDSFGFNWNLPQFLVNAGIDSFVTTKITWNDTNVFPHRLFWWESPDGSKVLTYFPNDYMNKIDNPFEMIEFVRQFEANTGFRDVLFLFGIGDHGGGPSWQMLQRINDLKNVWIFPKIKFTSLENYFKIIKKNDLTNLPIWKNELYLEFHRGTYTSQAKIKKWNRISEVLLNNAEKLSAIASINESEKLEKAWKNVLFNQFHDILPGTSIPSVSQDAFKKYKKTKQLGDYIINKSANKIINNIKTKELPEGEPVVLFNTLSWDRKDIVTINLPEGDKNKYIIFNEKGEEIPSQIEPIDELSNRIIFRADIPAHGYAVYGIKKRTPKVYDSKLKVNNNIAENKYFKVEVNKKNGLIKQIIDKRTGRTILSSEGNKLQMFGNKVPLWKAWNINYTGEEFFPKFIKTEIIEQGTVRTVFRSYYEFLHPRVEKPYPTEDFPTSFFILDVILYDEMDFIDFRAEVDWWEDEIILKVAFPLNIKGNNATYEIPYGAIFRSSDLSKQENKGKYEVPALRWADLSDNDYGVSLINNSKYGYDINENILRLTLLNSPVWPDPNANRGKNIIEYRLYPHQGDWKKAKTVQKGYEFNYPVLSFYTDKHNGKLKLKNSFVNVSPDNIILSTIKNAEENKDALILQFYETLGTETEAVIELKDKPEKVFLSNFLEEEIAEIDFVKNIIKVNVKPHQVKTIKIYREKIQL